MNLCLSIGMTLVILSGGIDLSVGSVLDTVLGCLIIGVLNNGLVLMEVSPFWQQLPLTR